MTDQQFPIATVCMNTPEGVVWLGVSGIRVCSTEISLAIADGGLSKGLGLPIILGDGWDRLDVAQEVSRGIEDSRVIDLRAFQGPKPAATDMPW